MDVGYCRCAIIKIVQVEWAEAVKTAGILQERIPGLGAGGSGRLLPDEYTNKIIITTTSEEDLQEFDRLLAELDVRPARRL